MTTEEYLKLFVTRDVICFIAEDENVDVKTAMEKWYTSAIFEKLQVLETGLYRESGSYVYELYKEGLS
jgi:hypothetical protein